MSSRSIHAGVTLAPLCLLFLAVGGCSTYIEGFNYEPRPAVALVPATQPSDTPPLASIVSVAGVRRAADRLPESVEVRIRLENNGPYTVIYDPKTMVLLDGGLMEMPAPILVPPQPITLGPEQSVVVGAYFPFPPGRSYKNTDLESLQLRWHVQVGGTDLPQAAEFRRVIRAYYNPYWDSPYPYGPFDGVSFGFVYSGHRR